MSVLVTVLRAASLLAFAAPRLLVTGRHEGELGRSADRVRGKLTPVAANAVAFGVFLACLFAFAGSTDDPAAPVLALCGCLVAFAGAALVLRARAELGSAWSFVPAASHETGLVTTGPYNLVRHPIYLGLIVLATGQAVAFGSWPALVVVPLGIVPTFAWRALAEEKLLGREFNERYAAYRRQSKMIIPYVL